jgi:hypothetical protein
MAEAKEIKNSFTFVKGFNTEASGLTFPENASIDEENFDLFLDGSRRKRLGIDFDTLDFISGGGSVSKASIDQTATSSFRWEGAGEGGNLSITVVQIGGELFFSNGGGPDIGDIDLSPLSLTPFQKLSGYQNISLSYTSSGNRLFITSSHIKPFYIKHSFLTPFADTRVISLQVRDLEGLDDGFDNDTRPTNLPINTAKYYNLINQGWSTSDTPGSPVIAANQSDGASGITEITNTADYFKTINGVFPSNSDIFHLLKLDAAVEPASVGAYWPGEVKKQYLGNSKAPRGHNILEAFNKVRADSGVLAEVIAGGPDSVAFYAGRTFHAQGSKVFFSQTIVEDVNIGKCYQAADPTVEDANVIVDTDGGEITISEASEIKQLATFSDKLVVFAKNGVWAIDGADSPFSATNLRVVKVTDTGVSYSRSAIAADDSLVYTTSSGIYTIVYDSSTGLLAARNISQTTIQTFYNNNILPGILTIKGKYDRLNKKVFWLFNDGSSSSRYYDILILDVTLGAFYKHKIGTIDGTAPFITDFYEVADTENLTEEFNVVDPSSNTVIDSNFNQVVAEQDRSVSRTSIFNFFSFSPLNTTTYDLGTASFKDSSFVDWKSIDTVGTTYEAFVTTGYELNDDLMRKKQSPIIQVAFNRTESRFIDNGSGGVAFDRPSSCKLKAAWDWSDNTVSGKVGNEQEAYRFRRGFLLGQIGQVFDDGLPIVTTRTKLRGRGRALSLNFRSPTGKDCQLLGWAVLFAGDTSV